MTFTRRLVLGVLLTAAPLPVAAQEPKPPSTEQVEKLHRMLKPQPGESRWMEIRSGSGRTSSWLAKEKRSRTAGRDGKGLLLKRSERGSREGARHSRQKDGVRKAEEHGN